MRILYFALVTLIMLFPGEAHAYIDPGSGSAIMSVIIGFFVAIGLAVKTFWYKIKSILTGKKAGQPLDQSHEVDIDE